MSTRPCIKCGGTERLLFSGYSCDSDACRGVGPDNKSYFLPPPTVAGIAIKQLVPDELRTKIDAVVKHFNLTRFDGEVWSLARRRDELRVALNKNGLMAYCLLDASLLECSADDVVWTIGLEMAVLRDMLAAKLKPRVQSPFAPLTPEWKEAIDERG